jgi:hypothetical protein
MDRGLIDRLILYSDESRSLIPVVEYAAKGSYWKLLEDDELAMGTSPLKMIPHLIKKAHITALNTGRRRKTTYTYNSP